MNASLGAWLKRLDPIAAAPACAIGGIVGKLRDQAETHEEPLIVRPGGLGDLVCAHIALERLGVPIDSVRWLIEPRSQPWADHLRLRYEFIAPTQLPPLHRLVIDTEQRFGLSLAYSLLARARGGRLHGFATNRMRRCADATTPYDPFDMHEVESFTRLFSAALDLPTPALPLRVERRLAASAGLVVGIAGRQEPTRTLNIEQWTEFIAHFTDDRPFTLVAAPADAAFAEQLAQRFASRATLHRGNFASVCELIAQSEMLLTIDGGLVHVASYYGVPTTAIFTGGRDRKWAPLGDASVLIRRTDLPCQPCTLFGQTPPCPHGLACHRLDPSLHRLPISPRN